MGTLKVMIARWVTWLVDRLAFRHPRRTSSMRVRDVRPPDLRRDVQSSHASEKDEVERFEGEGGTGNAPPPPTFRSV